ncbi:hypothetical protein [Peribacillus glennii]|nr:hypothetical protein [Peribacillus glennii]
MKEKKDHLREDSPVSNTREEFGTEFTGGLNAAKIYDVLVSGKRNKPGNK